MKEVLLEYGDGKMPVQLPDSAVVVRYGETYQDPPPAEDPVEVTRRALANPLGMRPLRELAKPGDRVAIAFPDRVKGGFHQQSHRRISIPMMIEELRGAGVRDEDITLVCAPGLHRNVAPESFPQDLPQSQDSAIQRLQLLGGFPHPLGSGVPLRPLNAQPLDNIQGVVS